MWLLTGFLDIGCGVLGIEVGIILYILYIMVKISFALFPCCLLGSLDIIRNKHRYIQYSMDYYSDTILCLCIAFVSLFVLPDKSNPHATTMEYMNPSSLDPYRCHPNLEPRQKFPLKFNLMFMKLIK